MSRIKGLAIVAAFGNKISTHQMMKEDYISLYDVNLLTEKGLLTTITENRKSWFILTQKGENLLNSFNTIIENC